MKTCNFRSAYIKKKSSTSETIYRTNLVCLKHDIKQSGVYLLMSRSKRKIVYIGMSCDNLYKTIFRHLQTWNDSQQERFVYDKEDILVKIILLNCKDTPRLERYYIEKYNPPDNKSKLENYTKEDQERAAEIADEVKEDNYINDEIEVPF